MRYLFISLFVLLFVIPFVLATDTEITIQTLPNYEVQATASPAGDVSFSVLDSIINQSDEKGRINFVFSVSKNFNLIVYIKKDGKTISQGFKNPTKLNDNVPGEPIYLELIPDWFEPEGAEDIEENLNETEENDAEVEVVNESDLPSEEANVKLTGSTVSGTLKKTTYSIIGIIALVIIIFLIFKFWRKSKGKKEIKIKKLSEIQNGKEEKPQESKEHLEAEKELEIEQKKVNEMKKNEEINRVKKKIVEYEEELIKLRKKK